MTDQLPQAIDMERATIAAVLINRDAMAPAAALLPLAADFYDMRHAAIWQVALDCWDSQTPPDLNLLADGLRKAGKLEMIGGFPYLLELTDVPATSYHVSYYAERVAEAATRRRGLQAMVKGSRLFADESSPLQEVAAAVQGDLDAALIRTQRRQGVTMKQAIDEEYAALDTTTVAPGICTGYRDLDEMTGGLQRSDLIILAARPAVGKSSLALGLAFQIAQDRRRVLFVSLEMSYPQLVQRMLAMETGIDMQRLRLRKLRDTELPLVLQGMDRIRDLDITIEDDAGLTVQDIRARALRNIAQHGPLDLLVVDYLQLMQGIGKSDNRVQEVSEISRGLKRLARELDVPVVALSQLSRAVEGRTSHVPMLSDLRESGSLEQDADIVMFIYRDELYNPETENKGVAEIHIAKHRNGPVGVVPLRFEASTTKFSNLTYRTPDGY